VVLLSGSGFLWLDSSGGAWLHAKLLGVAGMYGFHGLLEMHLAGFARGARTHAPRYFRVINEIPTILLIWIVIWVVVRPFS
jgi:protoporphyrinogen IX oxidase